MDSRPLGTSPDGVAALLSPVVVPTADCYHPGYYRDVGPEAVDPVCAPTSPVPECAACDPRVDRRVARGLPLSAPIEGDFFELSVRWRHDMDEDGGGGIGIRCVRDGS